MGKYLASLKNNEKKFAKKLNKEMMEFRIDLQDLRFLLNDVYGW